MVKADQVLGKHVFCFNKHDNGGESLILITDIMSNGDPNGVFLNQELTLNSYCNSASFNLLGAPLTPELLRKLADELEGKIEAAKKEA